MDPQITQSEVRLNGALEQRGQMDQQMLEKFQFVGSKCRSRILVFTYASVEPINFFFSTIIRNNKKIHHFSPTSACNRSW